jgi:hypothetical protein
MMATTTGSERLNLMSGSFVSCPQVVRRARCGTSAGSRAARRRRVRRPSDVPLSHCTVGGSGAYAIRLEPHNDREELRTTRTEARRGPRSARAPRSRARGRSRGHRPARAGARRPRALLTAPALLQERKRHDAYLLHFRAEVSAGLLCRRAPTGHLICVPRGPAHHDQQAPDPLARVPREVAVMRRIRHLERGVDHSLRPVVGRRHRLDPTTA